MGARLRLWWKKPGGHTKTIVLIALIIGMFVLLWGGYLLDCQRLRKFAPE
jgi:hypothetical protein